MSYGGLTDAELMAAFYRCEKEAFDELTGRWFGRLVLFFMSLGWRYHEAEDLAQETLVKIFRTK